MNRMKKFMALFLAVILIAQTGFAASAQESASSAPSVQSEVSADNETETEPQAETGTTEQRPEDSKDETTGETTETRQDGEDAAAGEVDGEQPGKPSEGTGTEEDGQAPPADQDQNQDQNQEQDQNQNHGQDQEQQQPSNAAGDGEGTEVGEPTEEEKAEADILPVTETEAICRIGEIEYDSFDKAFSAVKDGETIELLADAKVGSHKYIAKSFTIKGNGHTLSSNNYDFNLISDSELTFDNCIVDISADTMNSGNTWGWLIFCLGSGSSLNLINNTVFNISFDSSQKVHCAFYGNESGECEINISNNSQLNIAGKNTKGVTGDGIQCGKSGNVHISVTEGSMLSIDGANRGYANSPEILVQDSTLSVKNCTANASNGGKDTFINSTIIYENNAGHGLSSTTLDVQNSKLYIRNNGYCGIAVSGDMKMDGTSEAEITGNGWNNLSGQGALRLSGKTEIEASASVNITDNYCIGIYLNSTNASLNVKEGAALTITGNGKLTDGDHGYPTDSASSGARLTTTGGGIWNLGQINIPNNTVLYNNHASIAGDDVYNDSTGTIMMSSIGTGWMLDGDPDCTDAIDGWYDDSEGQRWEAHIEPYHAEKLQEQNYTITGQAALKAAHGVENSGDEPDTDPIEWDVSKSKTATNLDSNYESQVTLSLPAADVKPAVDIVMVIDVSSSMKDVDIQEVKNAANVLCDQLAEKTNVETNIGIVTFDKTAHKLTDGLVSVDAAREAINSITASEDTNMVAGLMAGKEMLDAGTATEKHLVVMSDGIPIYWMENGEVTSKTLISYAKDGVTELGRMPAGTEPEGSNNAMTVMSMEEILSATDWATDSNEWKQISDTGENINQDECRYTNIQKASYMTAKYLQDNILGQYNVKMVAFGTDKYEGNIVYQYGENFCDWVGEQEGVSYYKISKPGFGGEEGELSNVFESIANEVIHLLDAGSRVEDYMGYVENDYNFDFVNELDKIKLTVGGAELPAVQIDSNTYGFGASNGSSDGKTYPFVVTYVKGNGAEEEHFVWNINVPVTIDSAVQLTYTVRLNNPKTETGSYGKYDKDGSQGYEGLYTNNSATLFPVDSKGNEGASEEFNKPTVSYTVADHPATINITKKVQNSSGAATNVNATFYAAVFTDPQFTNRFGDVVELKLNGTSQVTVSVTVEAPADGSSRSYYVTETDKNGNVITGGESFGYQIGIEGSMVTVSESAPTGSVTITNKQVASGNQGGGSNGGGSTGGGSSSGSGSSSSQTVTSAQTGDNTNILLPIAVVVIAAAALTVCLVVYRRKRS